MNPVDQLAPDSAVVVIDVQNDFCPGGALPIEDGDRVVPVINRWIDAAELSGAVVAASRDWHPPNHISFTDRGGEWPRHCVQNTEGAEFHPDLELPDDAFIISKGQNPDDEQYSAFDDTVLAERLREAGVQQVWIGGLALDVCVRASALHAVEAGFNTRLIPDASYPVDPDEGREALAEMRTAGVSIEGFTLLQPEVDR